MRPSQRYYPGFFGALFLILLRTAIGWHVYYEGMEKYHTEEKTGKPWTAEPYLRASAGPFAEKFRALVPDVDSLDALDPDRLFDRWDDAAARTTQHFAFEGETRDAAQKALDDAKAKASAWFADAENAEKVRKYRDEIEAIRAKERETLTYERERLTDRRKALEGTRRELAAVVDGWTRALQDAWGKLAGAELAHLGPPKPPETELDRANKYTMYGLIFCGIGLMLGLLTRISALGAAILIGLFYFSMPPLPGLPLPPNSEGHYLIVNKNLIEMLALLVLASTRSGMWLGLDALLFGWFDRAFRRSEAAIEAEEIETSPRRL